MPVRARVHRALSASLLAAVATGCTAPGAEVEGPPGAGADPGAPAPAVAAVPSGIERLPDGTSARAGAVVIGFRPGALARFDARAAGLAGPPRKVLARHDVGLFLLRPGEGVAEAIRRLGALPDVAFAEPDRPRLALDSGPASDPYRAYQWNLDSVRAEEAWVTGAGRGSVVAVVDTGVSTAGNDEPALFVDGYDFVGGDADPTDDNGHGTHVAGTVAQATGNGVGCAGVAPDAAIMPIKALAADGSGSSFDVALAIAWAVEHGADVVNLSLGSPWPSTAEELAVQAARDAGVVLVAAAGNTGSGIMEFPAAYEGVIGVGASAVGDRRADYSNWGGGLDLLAPGGDLEADRDGDGMPDGILQESFGPTWGYYLKQGTSMAAPHVSAAAAILVSLGASGPDEVERLVEAGARDLGDPGWDAFTGAGRLDVARSVDLMYAAPPDPRLYMSKVLVERNGSRLIVRFVTSEPAIASVVFQNGRAETADRAAETHDLAVQVPDDRMMIFTVRAEALDGDVAESERLHSAPSRG